MNAVLAGSNDVHASPRRRFDSAKDEFPTLAPQILPLFMPLLLLLVISLALTVGCSNGPATRATTVAFAIRNTGSVTPTEQQLGYAVRALQHHLVTAGYRLADTPTTAHVIVNAEFIASTTDPAGGHLRIVSLEPSSVFMKTVTSEGETEEGRQMRERLRDIERWIDMQSKTRPGEGAP